MKRILLLAFVLMVSLSARVYGMDTVVTASVGDIDSNGRNETVKLVLNKGRKYDDEELWCGAGWKYEGFFSITATFNDGRQEETSLNSLWYGKQQPPEELFFFSEPWTIQFADYNHDGVIDFNLGQYSGCNGNEHMIFSFRSDGTVYVLPIYMDGKVALSDHDNSSARLKLTDKGFSAIHYNNEIGGNREVFYDWDTASKSFMPNRIIDVSTIGDTAKKTERILDRQSQQYRTVSTETYAD